MMDSIDIDAMDTPSNASFGISFLHKPEFVIPTMCIYTLFTVVGIIANLVLIFVIGVSKSLHSVTNVFIAQLATGDLLILIFCMPFTVASAYLYKDWPFGEGVCWLVLSAGCAGPSVSILTLLVISCERYTAVVRPMKSKRVWSKRNVILASIVIYLVAVGRAVLRPLLTGTYRTYVDTKTQAMKHKCGEMYGTTFAFWYHLIGVLFFYVLILGAMVAFYYKIAQCLSNKTSQDMMKNNPKVMAERRGIILMLIVIVTTFCSCWLIANTVSIMKITNSIDGFKSQNWYITYVFFGRILQYGNCVVNPFIYGLLSSRFKASLKRLMMRCCCMDEKMADSKGLFVSDSKCTSSTSMCSTQSEKLPHHDPISSVSTTALTGLHCSRD